MEHNWLVKRRILKNKAIYLIMQSFPSRRHFPASFAIILNEVFITNDSARIKPFSKLV